MASGSIATYKQALQSIQKGESYLPVYWLEGNESFFIDDIIRVATEVVIPEKHKDFNQHILFGQDSKIADVVSTCKQAPVAFERQLVVIKEAQLLRDIDKLSLYLERPSPYTVLIVAFKEKTLDKRISLGKWLAKANALFSFPSLYANELQSWTGLRANHYRIKMTDESLHLLVNHVGNNLSLLDQELKKLSINIPNRPIEAKDIYHYVGINKTYNFYELQTAVAQKNISKAYQIIAYFRENEKAFPIQYALTMLYGFFSKIYILYGSPIADQKEAAAAIGVSPYFVGEYLAAKKNYSFDEVCLCIVLIDQCYRKSVGIHAAAAEKESLLTELIFSLLKAQTLLRAAGA